MPRLSASSRKATKSARVPSSGWIASWPPSAPPMAHGLPGSSGAGVEGVAPALAVGRADRVDRRQVHDVEAHGGDGRQPLGRAGEAALAPGEQLVPGAGPGPLPVDPQARRVRWVVRSWGSGTPARSPARWSSRAASSLVRSLHVVLRSVAAASSTRSRSSFGTAVGELVEQVGADEQLDGEVGLAGRRPLGGVVAPGGEPVGPRLDHQLVGADRRGRRRCPRSGRCRRGPWATSSRSAAPDPAQADPGGDLVVAVAEDVGRDRDVLAHRALRRVAGGGSGADVGDLDATHRGARPRSPCYHGRPEVTPDGSSGAR